MVTTYAENVAPFSSQIYSAPLKPALIQSGRPRTVDDNSFGGYP